MKKRLVLKPHDFECTLMDCPPGFFLFETMVGFKSEYFSDNTIEAFNCGGEYLWADAKTEIERRNLKVIPLIYTWELE